jgi:hypothetical protein
MNVLTKAKNTLYFKAFNEDYRIGGRYHSLDNSEFRCIVILQSYADGSGLVADSNGKGYNKKELADMIGLNGRTTERALLSLMRMGIISISDDDIIAIAYFVNDNVYRDASGNKVTRGRANLAKGIQKTQENQAAQMDLLSQIAENTGKPLVVITDDAEIKGKATRGEQNAD